MRVLEKLSRLPLPVGIILLVCLVGASACDVAPQGTMHTPTGIACHYVSYLGSTACVYYLDDGVPTPCQLTKTDDCTSTTGGFYIFEPPNSTYYCGSDAHATCSSINNNPITDPTALCPAPTFTYSHVVTKGEAWAVVDQEQDQNTTGVSDTVTFESTTSKTVTVSVSTDTSIYADITFKAVTVGVHQETATTVETSTTTAVGNTYAFTIPPKSVAYGIYGVKMDITTGHLTAKEPYNHSPCTSLTKDYGIVTANVPISKGWCVWLSGQKPCPTLS